jgi:DNA-binding MarR family transcriptional regulator
MNENAMIELARYIFSTGRLIHDHVLKIQARCVAVEGKKAGFEDLSLTQLYAVRAARDQGEVTISQLADLLEVSPPSASTLVDRLVEKGILTRKRSSKDRRVVVVSVSPEAAENIARVEQAIYQSFVEIVNQVGLETAQQWSEVLGKVKKVIERQNEFSIAAKEN